MSPALLIANSNVAAVVSDPRLRDNPIITCNEAFVALTGYSRDEVLGRNCRFLRGKDTDPERAKILRDAVEGARPAMVELVNYRKDGTPFRNAVMIAPLFDEAGDLRYFLGSQMDVDASRGGGRSESGDRIGQLTPRQRQVLEGLARGQLNKQIAYALGLKERTVKMHRAALLRNLGVATNAEAIRIAIESGL